MADAACCQKSKNGWHLFFLIYRFCLDVTLQKLLLQIIWCFYNDKMVLLVAANSDLQANSWKKSLKTRKSIKETKQEQSRGKSWRKFKQFILSTFKGNVKSPAKWMERRAVHTGRWLQEQNPDSVSLCCSSDKDDKAIEKRKECRIQHQMVHLQRSKENSLCILDIIEILSALIECTAPWWDSTPLALYFFPCSLSTDFNFFFILHQQSLQPHLIIRMFYFAC